jgi:hypothetical protein
VWYIPTPNFPLSTLKYKILSCCTVDEWCLEFRARREFMNLLGIGIGSGYRKPHVLHHLRHTFPKSQIPERVQYAYAVPITYATSANVYLIPLLVANSMLHVIYYIKFKSSWVLFSWATFLYAMWGTRSSVEFEFRILKTRYSSGSLFKYRYRVPDLSYLTLHLHQI